MKIALARSPHVEVGFPFWRAVFLPRLYHKLVPLHSSPDVSLLSLSLSLSLCMSLVSTSFQSRDFLANVKLFQEIHRVIKVVGQMICARFPVAVLSTTEWMERTLQRKRRETKQQPSMLLAQLCLAAA